MASLDRIVFARRQSPDWAALARDHEAGLPIDPSRYTPRGAVPGFPTDIAACIRTWNETFPVNFFRCRQILKVLSEHSIHQVDHSIIMSVDKLADLSTLVADARFLLFFFDDDDWFAPDMFERLSELDFSQCDVAVFPLARFADKVVTFVRDGEPARTVVGTRRGFGHRFQTNNYGITTNTALSEHLPRLQDHVLGSTYATQVNLTDAYFDVLISATNKTPCSANTIGQLIVDPTEYRQFIKRYVTVLREVEIDPELTWMAGLIEQTIDLFREI